MDDADAYRAVVGGDSRHGPELLRLCRWPGRPALRGVDGEVFGRGGCRRPAGIKRRNTESRPGRCEKVAVCVVQGARERGEAEGEDAGVLLPVVLLFV